MEYPDAMGDLTRKLLLWIAKFGSQKDQIRETGLPQSALSKFFEEDRQTPYRVTLNHLERIAKTRGVRASQILLEAEDVELPGSREPRRGTLSVVDQARLAWEDLFDGDPLRGRRVLANLQHQEQLGYTDLISNVVRSIIDHGPNDAIPIVTKLLHDATKEIREAPKTAKLREGMAREYRRIR